LCEVDEALLNYQFFKFAQQLFEEYRAGKKQEEFSWLSRFINESKLHRERAIQLYKKLSRSTPKKVFADRLTELENSLPPDPID